MKRLFFILFTIFALFCPHAQAAETPIVPIEDYVRLHVLANSDSAEDQSLKLTVRDAVLSCAREMLKDTCCTDCAYEILTERKALLEDCARQTAENAGFRGNVSVVTGTFEFPDRQYGELLVPAGEYRAVRVLLGEAEGKNWWCVIYPTLCAIDENNEFIPERSKIVFYSSIGRWLHTAFGGRK